MEFLIRFLRTGFLVLCLLFPTLSPSANQRKRTENNPNRDSHGVITPAADRIVSFLRNPDESVGRDGSVKIFVPRVFPLAAPFLLYRLKRTGFSACRVTVTDGGLLVTSNR